MSGWCEDEQITAIMAVFLLLLLDCCGMMYPSLAGYMLEQAHMGSLHRAPVSANMRKRETAHVGFCIFKGKTYERSSSIQF